MDEKKVIQLEKMIWELTIMFFDKNKNSFLSPDAILDKENKDIYNSTFSELIYDIKKDPRKFFDRKVSLHTIITNEETLFYIYDGKSGYYPGELVFSSVHNIECTDTKKIKILVKGDWEQEILKEYQKRLGENQ